MKDQFTPLKEKLTSTLFKPFQLAAMALVCSSLLFGCSGDAESQATTTTQEEPSLAQEAPVEDDGKGIGPISTVEVGAEVDEALAANGKTIFEGKCAACHQLSDQKIVGPGLAGVTERRKPEWVMNMIINPEEMTKKDPQAKKLLAEHLTQMTNQDIAETDARALLEFLRQNDKNI